MTFNQYIDEADGKVWRDPTPLFRQLARDRIHTTLLVKPGTVDLVDWRKVVRRFGGSFVKVGLEPSCVLRESSIRSISIPTRVYIRPEASQYMYDETDGQIHWPLGPSPEDQQVRGRAD